MAILIFNLNNMIGDTETWRSTLAEYLPNREVRFVPDIGDPFRLCRSGDQHQY